MSYRFEREDSVPEGLRRIAGEQIAKGLSELHDPALGTHDAVHQVRKRCKKLRGLLRLVRGGALANAEYSRENARYRDAARRLSALRDAEALTETYDRLMANFEGQVDRRAFGPVRRALTRRRKELATRVIDIDDRLEGMEDALIEGREAVNEIPMDDPGKGGGIAPGLGKTYGRAVKAMAKAQKKGGDERLHEWRKRVKYHWHHVRLMQNMWPRPMKARRRELKALADLLGDDHDLAAFRQVLTEEGGLVSDPETAAAMLGLIEQRRGTLQHHAFRLGRRLFAEKPDDHVARSMACWRIWRDGGHRTGAQSAVRDAA